MFITSSAISPKLLPCDNYCFYKRDSTVIRKSQNAFLLDASYEYDTVHFSRR